MKKVIALLILLSLTLTGLVYAEQVRGYYRSNGTYVNSYNRSTPNSTVTDNYSFKGNTNPSTGETGSNYYRNSSSSPYYGTSNSRSSWGGTSNLSGWGRDR